MVVLRLPARDLSPFRGGVPRMMELAEVITGTILLHKLDKQGRV